MSVLLFAEHSNGSFKKAVREAAGYAAKLAADLGVEAHAVAAGNVSDEELQKLGNHGITKIHKVQDDRLNTFDDKAYAAMLSQAAETAGAKAVVMAQSYSGKAVAPRLAVRLDAALVSGATTYAQKDGDALVFQRLTNSGKGIATVKTHRPVAVITLQQNSFGVQETGGSASVEAFEASLTDDDFGAKAVETVKTASKISITEADVVVSGGRGFKGPENWHLLEDMAEHIGAGTACSKPVADMEWRPHHEHVGQTGIQIAPNLYIAIGISGAIQHLAGVNSSKNIVVINKDPEAPFFKIADWGIVGDLFEVVPKMNEAIRQAKAATA